MNFKVYAAGLCVAVIAGTALAVPAAQAQTKKSSMSTPPRAGLRRNRARG